jgi:hypothetical protein
MFEITLYPSDLENLKNGHKLILYNAFTGKPEASLLMDKPDELKIVTSKLPTENVDNPVSNCT